MKFAHDGTVFHPITITLETEDEARIMKCIIGETSPYHREKLLAQDKSEPFGGDVRPYIEVSETFSDLYRRLNEAIPTRSL